MIFKDNLKMMCCLNDTGLDKAHELLMDLLENKEYTQFLLEQLDKENEESSKQRDIERKKEDEERKLKKEVKTNQIKQQFKKELSILKEQGLPIKQLDLLYGIQYIEESNAITLCYAYLWGYIQGKRDERARRKKTNTIKDVSNIPMATLKQIIVNRIMYINDLKSLQDVLSQLVEKEGVKYDN